ncbi:hypothetical protein [Phascolarctobacterium succinatutens]|uniref:hypothetical protein n=1 Tax=Phascolarctobacterium succinatutens TaxID=626940 RepID=UPI0026EE14B7|nr:hypothetical protein [Phascolarctobacterium succinatutens]
MSQLRKMERRKQKKLHLLGGEERVQVKAGDMEPFGISKSGYNAIYQAGFEAGVKAEREKLTLYYARYFTHQILAVCCKILMEHYGEIHVRKTRLEKFVELYGRGLEMLGDDESTEQYLRYIENYGIHINWKEPET